VCARVQGVSIVGELLAKEGPAALFKGAAAHAHTRHAQHALLRAALRTRLRGCQHASRRVCPPPSARGAHALRRAAARSQLARLARRLPRRSLPAFAALALALALALRVSGLAPKLLTVGPKLVFSFTVAQYLIALSDRMLS
jgi:hypothetical protein